MDSHHQVRVDAGFGSGSRGRTCCLFPFPLILTPSHALPLTVRSSSGRCQSRLYHARNPPSSESVPCTHSTPAPFQLNHFILLTPPAGSTATAERQRTCHRRCHTLCHCRIQPARRRGLQVMSVHTPHSDQVSCIHPSFYSLPSSVNTFVYSSQSRRRWIIRNGLVV